MKIAILLGGTSPERHVSMASGRGIALALNGGGHDVTLIDPALGANGAVTMDELVLPGETSPSDEELRTYSHEAIIDAVRAIPSDIDVVFLALHGAPGEDGTVQSLLELRGIAYTGSGVLASALAMDKAMTKRIIESHDVATPRWFSLERGEATTEQLLDMADRHTGFPLVVKPNDGGSTVGMSIVRDREELVPACELAARYSSTVLFEEYIEGRELTVAILGADSLPIVEIRPHSGFYDYRSKYTPGQTDYICPADLPRALEEEVRELARRAHVSLGCRGYSRVDFRLDENNVPYCLEINTLPGMTATSLVPKAAAAVGLSYADLCKKIVDLALTSRAVEL